MYLSNSTDEKTKCMKKFGKERMKNYEVTLEEKASHWANKALKHSDSAKSFMKEPGQNSWDTR